MRLSGSYFDLTDRFAPRTGTGAAGAHRKIVISVPKRLVSSAVRRNTVKRIVREAWRLSVGVEGRACLVRLTRYPGTAVKPDRKAVSGAGRQGVPGEGVAGREVRTAAPGFSTTKRLLRDDADKLFAAFVQGRSDPTRRTR